MENNRYQLHFVLAIIVILATGGFIMIEVTNMTAELVLLESLSYSIVKNSDARLSAEINRTLEEINIDSLEEEIRSLDFQINNL